MPIKFPDTDTLFVTSDATTCPHCGSDNQELDELFWWGSPYLIKDSALYHCLSCGEYFAQLYTDTLHDGEGNVIYPTSDS